MIKQRQIWLVAFLEGAVVMAVEIASAKLIAPWFGASLYVWASVLGVTMAGLAAGYFVGGRLSQKASKISILGKSLAFAGILTMAMPYLGAAIMSATLHWEPRWGSLLSAMVFLFPPIFCLGTISPMLVALSEKEGAGKAAGTIYGISTLGGILMTFAMGFWLMPSFGIKIPVVIAAAFLVLFGVYFLWKGKSGRIGPLAAIFVAALLSSLPSVARPLKASDAIVLHDEWGIDGEILVQDEHVEGNNWDRVAYINRREQSRVKRSPDLWCARHPYVGMMSRLAALQPSGSRALLLGLGGGSFLRELDGLGHKVEGCEIDGRMIYLAKEYFDAPDQISNIRNEDARVCINQMAGKFDMIFVDVFWGLQGPSHVLTLESLKQMHRHLDTKGLLGILFPGNPRDLHARSLARTMREAGFQVAVAIPLGMGSTGMVLIGTHLPYTPKYFSARQGTICTEFSKQPRFLPGVTFPIDSAAPLLTDDVPRMEVLMMDLGKDKAN